MKVYYQEPGIVIYHGDCREFDEPIGATVTLADPPYGETSLAWDRWPDGWLHGACGDSLWCLGSLRLFLERADEFKRARWKLAQDLVWEKQNGSSFAADRFKRVHELATHWYRGNWGAVYKAPVRVQWRGERKTVRKRGQTPHTGAIGNAGYSDDGTRLMPSIIYARNCQGYAEHPTQKPVALLQPLIEYSCPPGGTVYVPFAGVGSELETARYLGRHAVGVEIREDYCEMAANRLSRGLPLSVDAVDPQVSSTGKPSTREKAHAD